MTGRCGGTLTTAMVFKTGLAEVLHEPDVSALYTLLKYHDDMETVANTLRLLAPNTNKRYFIKVHSTASLLLPLFSTALPGICEIFLYRNVRRTAESWNAISPLVISEDLHVTKAYEEVREGKFMTLFRKHADPGFDIDQKEVFRIINKIACWPKDSGRDRIFQYEELLKDPTDYATRLLTACKIDTCHVPVALNALEQDSQRNSTFSMSKLKKREVISDKVMRVGSRIAEELGLKMDVTGQISLS